MLFECKVVFGVVVLWQERAHCGENMQERILAVLQLL
jgi:hypothetical protein